MRIRTFLVALSCLIGASKPSGEYCDHNFLGRYETGILRSYNYPFNYLHNLTCTYRIYLEHTPAIDSGPKTICFSFQRFSLENSTLFCSFDYLRFDTIKYCGQGLWHYGVLDNAESNVWYPNFCWPVKNQYFEIQFNSDNSFNGHGFYATYTILDGALQKPGPPAVMLGQAPCPEGKWTCFNRKCIPEALKCDGKDDCDDGSDESYTHAECGEQNIFSCDFSAKGGLSDGYCGFTQQGGDWFRTNTRTSPSGPNGDHTNTSTGYYIYTDTDHSPAYLVSPEITLPMNKTYCLSFWYYVYGDPALAGLKVYVNRGQTYQRPEWHRTVGDTGRWLKGEVTINTQQPLQVVFGADMENRFSGVALDDLSLLPGSCYGNDISCNFESTPCSWKPVQSIGTVVGNNEWHIQKRVNAAMGPLHDYSSSDGSGAYLFVISPLQSMKESRALMLSAPVSSFAGRPSCLRFAYYMAGAGDDCCILRIQLRQYNGTMGHALWMKNGRGRNSWRQAAINLEMDGPYEIVMEGVVAPRGRGQIAIDDVLLEDTGCPSTDTGTCSVGEYLCNDGMCISASMKCDGKKDCEDGSDEDWHAGCPVPTTTTEITTSAQCPSSYYHCNDNDKCIPPGWLCDSFKDCEDGSDENELAHCSDKGKPVEPACKPDEHVCMDGKCVPLVKVVFCDGVADCSDGSDEGTLGNCTGGNDNIGPNIVCKITDCSDDTVYLGVGVIAGIALACIVFVVVIVLVILFVLWKFHKRRQQERSAITYATDISTISYGDDSSVNRPMEIVEDSSLERPLERSFARSSRGSTSALNQEQRNSHRRSSHYRDHHRDSTRDSRRERDRERERERDPLHRSSQYRGSVHSLHRDTIPRNAIQRDLSHRRSLHDWDMEPSHRDSMNRIDRWVSRDSFHRIPAVHRESYIRRNSGDFMDTRDLPDLRSSCPELDQPDLIVPGLLHNNNNAENSHQGALPVQPPPYTPHDTMPRRSMHNSVGYVPEVQSASLPHDVFMPPDEPPPPYDSALKDAVVLTSPGAYRSHLMQSSV